MPNQLFTNYDIVEMLCHAKADVYRCTRVSDGAPAIAKVVSSSKSPEAAQRLRRELEILVRLHAAANPAIVAPLELCEQDNKLGLLMVDAAGGDLYTHLAAGPMAVREALHVASQVAAALTSVHANHLIHRDINPGNVIYNASSGVAQLIDFDIAMMIDAGAGGAAKAMEGTLPYMAPEQTGRTSRTIDHRADLYAVGALLYTLLAGKPLFDQVGPDEQILAIMTAYPGPLTHVPAPVMALVMRLLSKDPADRYMSAYGLRRDINRCIEALDAGGAFEPFDLGRDDHSERLEIGKKLYGRGAEVDALQAALQRAHASRAQLVLLHGPSGVGKSALVDALLASAPMDNDVLAFGKFDQLRRHLPLSAFSQAVDRLVRGILTQPSDIIESWRGKIQGALGAIGQALVDVAPAIELLIGKQKPVAKLPPFETENRLLHVVQSFLRCVTDLQPLVLFLDDVQWADSGTFKLLESLARDTNSSMRLLIICAYRDNEVRDNDALAAFVQKLSELSIAVADVALAPLQYAHVVELIADTLQRNDIDALARVVMDKTGGNAFFVGELLKHLWHNNLLYLDVDTRVWQWNETKIRALQVSDNVVDLLTGSLDAIPHATSELLSVAACLGDQFSEAMLAAVVEQTADQLSHQLWPALDAGLLIAVERSSDGARYKFAHDRVQQACFERLNPTMAMHYHHRIGRILLERRVAGVSGDVFAIVDHLNHCHAMLATDSERWELAKLNHDAGREAVRAAAYSVAQIYLGNATSLLAGRLQQTQPALAKDIELDLADCEYLNGDNAAANARLDTMLAHLPDPLDRVEVLTRRVSAMWGAGDVDGAIRLGLQGLALLGMRVELDTSQLSVGMALLRAMRVLRKQTRDSLLQLPFATDRYTITLAECISVILPLCFFSNRHLLLGRLGLELLCLTIERGRTPMSPGAFAFGSMTFAAALHDIPVSVMLSDVAHELARQDNNPRALQVWVTTFLTSLYWQLSTHDLAVVVDDAVSRGIASGDLVNASMLSLGAVPSWMGLSLHRAATCAEQARVAISARDSQAAAILRFYRQYVRCLRGSTDAPSSYNDAEFDEAAAELELSKFATPFPLVVYRLTKLVCAVTVRDFAAAAQLAHQIEHGGALDLFRANSGMLQTAFFTILSITQPAIAAGRRLTWRERRAIRRWRHEIDWFTNVAPYRHRSLLHLVDGEVAAAQGRVKDAAAHYEDSMATLLENRLFSIVSVECVARFYLRQGWRTPGRAYLQQARTTYDDWGAVRKVRALEQEFPELTVASSSPTQETIKRGSTTRKHTGTSDYGSELDVSAVLKTTQALSQEVVLSDLIRMLMQQVCASTGADQGALILRDGPDVGVSVRAVHKVRDGQTTLVSETLTATTLVPSRAINYALRTGDILLMRAGDNNALWDDAYFRLQPARSMVCAPLRRRGIIVGCIFLANGVDAEAFNPDRVALAEMIAAQGAISLENAELYGNLEDKVRARSEALQVAQERVLKLEKGAAEVQLAGGFAHEMRNALFPASMLLETLPDAPADLSLDLVGEALPPIKSAVQRALRITQQTLQYAQVAEREAQTAAVPVNQVVDDVLRSLADNLQKVDVRRDIAEGLQVNVKREHLYAIVHNLVHNAGDALHGQDGARELCIRAWSTSGGIQLRVEDSGPGVPEPIRSKLFTPFVTSKGPNGAGLGLGIVKKLVEAYSGQVDLESNAAPKTSFAVRLPMP